MNDTKPELKGTSEIARLLTKQGTRSVSRQAVNSWYIRRKKNGFPEAAACSERGTNLFDEEEVLAWYARYKPGRLAHWGKRDKTDGSDALHI